MSKAIGTGMKKEAWVAPNRESLCENLQICLVSGPCGGWVKWVFSFAELWERFNSRQQNETKSENRLLSQTISGHLLKFTIFPKLLVKLTRMVINWICWRLILISASLNHFPSHALYSHQMLVFLLQNSIPNFLNIEYSITVSVFVVGWVWQILNRKQILITMWWWDEYGRLKYTCSKYSKGILPWNMLPAKRTRPLICIKVTTNIPSILI